MKLSQNDLIISFKSSWDNPFSSSDSLALFELAKAVADHAHPDRSDNDERENASPFCPFAGRFFIASDTP